MGEVIVSMKDIVKTFPGVKALDHVNFELRSGEVMALLGENGAGKSTLMKILSGVYTKDSGTMTIFGTEYENLTPKQAQAVGGRSVKLLAGELSLCLRKHSAAEQSRHHPVGEQGQRAGPPGQQVLAGGADHGHRRLPGQELGD